MALPATDTFTRADENPLAGNWTNYGGSNRLVSNAAQGPSSSTDTFSKWNADTFSADQYSKYTIVSTAGSLDAGPAVRIGSSGLNGYFLSTYSSYSNYAKFVAGTFTALTGISITLAVNDVIELRAVGTGSGNLRGYKNGVALATTSTDSSLTSGGAGFFIYDSAARVGAWEGGDVGSGAVNLTPGLFTATHTFHAPTVGRGAVNLTPSLYTKSHTFHTPTVSLSSGSQELTPSLYTKSHTFHAPTVGRGSVELTPSLYTKSHTFYAPVVGRGSVGLTPGLFTKSHTFYAPVVGRGQVTLTPSLYTRSHTFHAPTVGRGAINLTPGLYTNSHTFYTPSVSVGAINLTPSLYTKSHTFYAPVVTLASGPQALTPSLYTRSHTFYAPTVALTSWPQEITPGIFPATHTFYAPVIGLGAVNLTPELFSRSHTFYTHTISAPPVGSINQTDIDAIANAVWAHSSALLIEQRLLEAWGRLGLDPTAPLITGQTTITFGAIVMAMTEAAGSITVTRQ